MLQLFTCRPYTKKNEKKTTKTWRSTFNPRERLSEFFTSAPYEGVVNNKEITKWKEKTLTPSMSPLAGGVSRFVCFCFLRDVLWSYSVKKGYGKSAFFFWRVRNELDLKSTLGPSFHPWVVTILNQSFLCETQGSSLLLALDSRNGQPLGYPFTLIFALRKIKSFISHLDGFNLESRLFFV